MDISRPDHKVQKVRRRLIWIVAAVGFAVAVLLAIMTLTDDTPRVKRASVWIDTVKRGAMLREVRGPGVLVPIDARWVAASSNARVERILIRPGAGVHANSVIMRAQPHRFPALERGPRAQRRLIRRRPASHARRHGGADDPAGAQRGRRQRAARR